MGEFVNYSMEKNKRPKVMVNILNMGEIRAGTETDMIRWMREYSDRYEFEFFLPSARPIPNNRNQIVTRFLKGDWDYLFMLDDDNYPIKNPFRLLEHDKPVVGGVYPGRGTMGVHFHVYKFGPDFPKKIFFKHYDPDEREGLRKVDAIATGCILIKRWVLEKMRSTPGYEAPFEDLFNENGELITNDDMAFCIKCHELGIDVWADWDLLCDHFKTVSLLEMIKFIQMAAESGIAKLSFSEEEIKKNRLRRK